MKLKHMTEKELEDWIIKGFCSGQTLKSLAKEITAFTMFEDGRALPKGYAQQVIFSYLHGENREIIPKKEILK